ncbi:diacylglycerol/lipid kinase family protein [Lichenifustis flavocetrariae]|uniref:Diacylglycerol kinase family lipid kinase n=1 Tax=Lichenifustis flavocetrariae TaxID=2949735 RepID=A0AA42CN02_9HYPH|nr:diacylglycerol kinase family protein [Lichenifustis flavocetrariae]MCW6512151.1 diacylglycerol kinase family lipid kinase [Lichenifustis flavocetrariae]
MSRVVTCILNESAGSHRAAEARRLITRIAAEQGGTAHIILSTDGSTLSMLAGQALADGALLAAGGGDGTVGTVAAALVDTNVALGVLPMGTRNHFAKDLGIPLGLEAAVRTLFTGRIDSVDVAEVNGRVFVNNSSIGIYPQIARERSLERHRGGRGWSALARAAARLLRRSPMLHVDLDVDQGQWLSTETSLVFVGNNRYSIEGLFLGSRASLRSGSLWIFVAPGSNRFTLLGLALRGLMGRVHDSDLATFDGVQASVRMHRAFVEVATDGEVNLMPTPLHYRIRPAALRVVVPQAS